MAVTCGDNNKEVGRGGAANESLLFTLHLDSKAVRAHMCIPR